MECYVREAWLRSNLILNIIYISNLHLINEQTSITYLNPRSRDRKDWKIYTHLNDIIYIIDEIDNKNDLKAMSLRFIIADKI